MLTVVVFIVLLVIAVDVQKKGRAQSAIFAEYQLSSVALGVALLLPLAPLVLLMLPRSIGWLPSVVLAAALCVPAGLVGRSQAKRFEVSGTDTTREALEAAQKAVTGSLIGLVYVAASGVWTAAIESA